MLIRYFHLRPALPLEGEGLGAGERWELLEYIIGHSLQVFDGYGFNDGITDTVKQHKMNIVLSPLFILSQGIKNFFPVELKSRRESQLFE